MDLMSRVVASSSKHRIYLTFNGIIDQNLFWWKWESLVIPLSTSFSGQIFAIIIPVNSEIREHSFSKRWTKNWSWWTSMLQQCGSLMYLYLFEIFKELFSIVTKHKIIVLKKYMIKTRKPVLIKYIICILYYIINSLANMSKM